MKHRDWQPGVWDQSTLHMLRDEHNDLFEAWRKAEARAMETLAENNRLDRELDEARRALKSTIRVPFSDAQIEAMAKAADECYSESWGATWPDAIRAALTAGGLEPCAVPERASDEEICAIFTKAHYGMPRDSIVAVSRHDANRFQPVVAAVRARVEAPLLAEIQRLTRERDGETLAGEESVEIIGELKADRDTLKARVAELEEGLVARTNTRLMDELAAIRAELEAERKRSGRFDGSAQALSKTVDDQRRELEAVKAERDHKDKGWNYALAQWEKALKETNTAKTQLAALRQRDTVPVKVRCLDSAETVLVTAMGGGNYPPSEIAKAQRIMDATLAHAVIDVPAGVPSVEELVEIADIAVDAMDMSHPFPGEVKAVWSTAIRDAVLTGVLPTTAPTDEQVEALAEVLHAGSSPRFRWDEMSELSCESYRAYARAAFAHFGEGPCKECAKMKEQRKAFRRIVIEGAEEVRNRIGAARAALEGE